jgi:hypothetical protein
MVTPNVVHLQMGEEQRQHGDDQPHRQTAQHAAVT